jgi:hypothetical protein
MKDIQSLEHAVGGGKSGYYDEELPGALQTARIVVQTRLLEKLTDIPIETAQTAIEILRPTAEFGQNDLHLLQVQLARQFVARQERRGAKKTDPLEARITRGKHAGHDAMVLAAEAWTNVLGAIGWNLRRSKDEMSESECISGWTAVDSQNQEYEIWFSQAHYLPGSPASGAVSLAKSSLAKEWSRRRPVNAAGLILIFTRPLYWNIDARQRTIVFGGLLWKDDRWAHFPLVAGPLDKSIALRDEMNSGTPDERFFRKYASYDNLRIVSSITGALAGVQPFSQFMFNGIATGTNWLVGIIAKE